MLDGMRTVNRGFGLAWEVETMPLSRDERATVPSTNLASEVYEELRKSIVEGSIRPNERLIEADLAAMLQVSRTPIRESMLRLAGDGLIVPHKRGWIVREHSQQEIREVYEIRAALEGFAAGLAAQRATDEELAGIKAIHQAYIDTVSDESRGQLVEHNDAFHNAVIAAAKNNLLAEQIHRNSQYYFIHRISGFLTDEEVRGSIAGHESVVQALVARDADLAESTARALVLEGLAKVLAHVR
jgi:DNA-binding GntR family transcriptional regulator